MEKSHEGGSKELPTDVEKSICIAVCRVWFFLFSVCWLQKNMNGAWSPLWQEQWCHYPFNAWRKLTLALSQLAHLMLDVVAPPHVINEPLQIFHTSLAMHPESHFITDSIIISIQMLFFLCKGKIQGFENTNAWMDAFQSRKNVFWTIEYFLEISICD